MGRGIILGSQSPRVMHAPKYVTSAGDEVIEMAELAGLVLDPWQQLVLRESMGEVPLLDHDGGVVEGEWRWAAPTVCLLCNRQNGKGPQSLDTPILTTAGWKTMGGMVVGDEVYGGDGKPTRVIGVSPVYPDERCSRVTFTDGASYVVADSHLWEVWDKGRTRRVMTTEQISPTVGNRRADNGRMEYRWRVRCDTVVQSPEKDLPIDPYIFGYWLGDGGKDKAELTVGVEDIGHVKDAVAEAGYTVVSILPGSGPRCFRLRMNTNTGMRDGFESRCKRLGAWGNKRIPDMYLTASPSQRRRLLAGLMDSDGHIAVTNRSPQAEISISYPDLAADFHRLARSLGIRVTPRVGKTERRDRTRFLWTPRFNPFVMKRKADRWCAPVSTRDQWMSITKIERVDSVPTRCIEVAAENGLYLTGRLYTPTHNSILEARELAGLFLLDEQVIIHSAHEQSTSSEHMRRLLNLIESVPEFDQRVKKVINGKGSEAIELMKQPGQAQGARILFKTRTGGGTRGFSIDLVVFDEAYDLPEAAVSAMVPTLSARPNVQTWYTSSAVDQEKHQNGDALARQRERGLKKAPRIAYFDWSVEGDDPSKVPEDVLRNPLEWANANPALGTRITLDTVQDELDGNLGAREFAVERLGIGDWPSQEPDAGRVISRDVWESLRERDLDKRIVNQMTFSLDVNPDRTHGSIGVSGMRADGLWQFAVARHGSGTGWMVDAVAELVKGRSATPIVVLARGPASNLIGDLEDRGLNVIRCSIQEYAEACADFFDTIARREVRYPFPQPELDAALTGAKRSSSENAWYWSRKASLSPDISSLVAVTIALWGAQHASAPTVWSLAEVATQAGLMPSSDSVSGDPSPTAPTTPGFVPM